MLLAAGLLTHRAPATAAAARVHPLPPRTGSRRTCSCTEAVRLAHVPAVQRRDVQSRVFKAMAGSFTRYRAHIQPAALLHNPQAPGARSTRSCAPRAWTRDPTRHSARRAVARSGPRRGPAHLTPHIRKWRPTNALSDLTELQRSHEGCHAVHRRCAGASAPRRGRCTGPEVGLSRDTGQRTLGRRIRRDSAGFRGIRAAKWDGKWDKVGQSGIKVDSEGWAPGLTAAAARRARILSSPVVARDSRTGAAVHRTMFRGVERIGGTLFPATAARSPRVGPGPDFSPSRPDVRSARSGPMRAVPRDAGGRLGATRKRRE